MQPAISNLQSRIYNLHPAFYAILISTVLTLLLYRGALSLPLFSDDLRQVPWVEQTSFLELWTSVGPYRDYRPLHFSLWKALALPTGDLTPLSLHALNLLGHVLSATLVGTLAARWSRRPRLTATLAGATFALYPFAFDAVPWAIAFSYPLTTALSAGALLAYLHARETRATSHHLLALALTGLAGFAHEGGVVLGATIVLAELTVCRPERTRFSPWSGAHLAASALPFIAAAAVRPQGTALHGLIWPDFLTNVATAVQTLAFPVAPLATPLARAGLDPTLALALVALPALVALGWTVARTRGPRPLLLVLGWWATWAIPPALTLHSDWLSDAPRAFYPAAAGAAILWAGIADRRRIRHALIATALLAASLLPAGQFVAGRMTLHRQTGDLFWDVVGESEEEAPILIVNLPSRITPPGRQYPLGHEGIIPLPREVGAADLVVAHTGREGAAFERAWGPLLPAALPYAVRPLGEVVAPADMRSAARIYVVNYSPDGDISLVEAGAMLPARPPWPAVAQFQDALALLDVDCRLSAPGEVQLVTRWRIAAPVAGSPTIFAHLLGPDGALVAQADGDPLGGLYPFAAWQPGDVVEDVRYFEGTLPAEMAVALGVWDPLVGERWAATDSSGNPLHDQAFRCVVPSSE